MMVIQRFAAFAELGVRDHANFIADVWLKLPSWLTLVRTCTFTGFRVEGSVYWVEKRGVCIKNGSHGPGSGWPKLG